MDDVFVALSPQHGKYGMAYKFYGRDWDPPKHEMPLQPDEVFDAMMRAKEGETLQREEFPEAGYVWAEKYFSKVKDIFWASGFLAVKGEMAEILKSADLGKGGLLPYPIYQSDKTMPYPVEAYLINFGGPQPLFLVDHTAAELMQTYREPTKVKVGRWGFQVESTLDDFEISVRKPDADCPDIWRDPQLGLSGLFMKGEIVSEIKARKINTDFKFKRCFIVEGGA